MRIRKNLSQVPLVHRIPNPSVRKMFEDKDAKTKTPRPGWAGYYSNIDERIHPFLTDLHVPDKFHRETGFQIVASAGGLVVIRRKCRPTDPESNCESKKTQTYWKTHWLGAKVAQVRAASRVAGSRRSFPQRRNISTSKSSSSLPQAPRPKLEHYGWVVNGWERLMVLNLASNQEWPLPEPLTDLGGLEAHDYRGVQIAMVLERDRYKVILVFRTSFLVYDSRFRYWTFARFKAPAVWGMDRVFDQDNNVICLPWGWVSAKATFGGRLYFADVVSEPDAKYTLRLFELDYDTATTWTLKNSFPLRKRHWSFLPCTYPRRAIGREMDAIRSVELVACMGELYAVILARTDELLTSEFTSVRTLEELTRDHAPGLAVLPIQFHILRVLSANGQDDDSDDRFAHRVQRVLVPKALRNTVYMGPLGAESVQARTDDLLAGFELTNGQKLADMGHNMFLGAAEGSVIYLTVCDCILKYDVVSGASTTGIIRDRRLLPTYTYQSFSAESADLKLAEETAAAAIEALEFRLFGRIPTHDSEIEEPRKDDEVATVGVEIRARHGSGEAWCSR